MSELSAVKHNQYARRIRLLQQRLAWMRTRTFGPLVKRSFDVLVSGLLLLILLIPGLLTILIIRLDSSGPAFFAQKRVGRHGRLFLMWKFRSMCIDAEQRLATLKQQNEIADNVNFKMKRDPRITRVGGFIRKFSIDEMPQLWNVFIGDMSLVGPRPPLPREVAQYTPYERQRLAVKPGITCVWQVSGRSDIPFKQQVEMDLHYIANQSFFYDIILLLKTIPAVLKAKGAY
ncbi:sugar transferase [Thioflexithrix psekupsensis]|nr:sugar transferase [Thioflexithrix psekupsensis]